MDFIEVPRPVQRSVRTMAAQGDGVAQTFAHAGEIPRAAVVTAVVMAGGAGDVFLQGQSRISGIIKELLPAQDGGAEFFRVDGIDHAERERHAAATLHEAADVMHADGAGHEVVNEKRAPVRRQRESLRREPGIEAGDDFPAPCIDDGHRAAAFKRDKEIHTPGIEDGCAGHA